MHASQSTSRLPHALDVYDGCLASCPQRPRSPPFATTPQSPLSAAEPFADPCRDGGAHSDLGFRQYLVAHARQHHHFHRGTSSKAVQHGLLVGAKVLVLVGRPLRPEGREQQGRARCIEIGLRRHIPQRSATAWPPRRRPGARPSETVHLLGARSRTAEPRPPPGSRPGRPRRRPRGHRPSHELTALGNLFGQRPIWVHPGEAAPVKQDCSRHGERRVPKRQAGQVAAPGVSDGHHPPAVLRLEAKRVRPHAIHGPVLTRLTPGGSSARMRNGTPSASIPKYAAVPPSPGHATRVGGSPGHSSTAPARRPVRGCASAAWFLVT